MEGLSVVLHILSLYQLNWFYTAYIISKVHRKGILYLNESGKKRDLSTHTPLLSTQYAPEEVHLRGFFPKEFLSRPHPTLYFTAAIIHYPTQQSLRKEPFQLILVHQDPTSTSYSPWGISLEGTSGGGGPGRHHSRHAI